MRSSQVLPLLSVYGREEREGGGRGEGERRERGRERGKGEGEGGRGREKEGRDSEVAGYECLYIDISSENMNALSLLLT